MVVDERLRRNGSEGVFDDAGDLSPIDAVITTGVEVTPSQVANTPDAEGVG